MSLVYQLFLRKFLFSLEPEVAHDMTCFLLSKGERSILLRKFLTRLTRTKGKSIRLFGLSFPNCIGLAAGLDKNGQFSGLSSSLGFGHVEVGTVTPLAQPGNPKPRLFRYEKEEALVNRMGFNNRGANALVKRLRLTNPKGARLSPVGINIGKGANTTIDNAIEDYLDAFSVVASQADYITINISSPNTSGLRDLHQDEFLHPLLESVRSKNLQWAKENECCPLPCLLKISPDEDFNSLGRIINLAFSNDIDGLIATNSTTRRRNFINKKSVERGGLSGRPLQDRSLQVIKFVVKEANQKLPVVGVGGICDSESAHKKLDAGASLLQLYTSFIYNGPFFPFRLVNSLHSRYNWP